MMSLFVNKELEHKVLLYPVKFPKSNQEVYRHQYLNEVLKYQNQINQKLTSSIDSINSILEQSMNKKQEIEERVGKDEIVHQAILAQLSTQDQIIINLTNKIESMEKEIGEFIINQQKTQNEMTSKIEVQDVYHQTVMERLEQQEANTYKISRQLENLRAVIFERINHLAEKVEIQTKHTIKSLTELLFKKELNKEENCMEKETMNGKL